MNLSEAEELSEREFTHRAERAGISTSVFLDK